KVTVRPPEGEGRPRGGPPGNAGPRKGPNRGAQIMANRALKVASGVSRIKIRRVPSVTTENAESPSRSSVLAFSFAPGGAFPREIDAFPSAKALGYFRPVPAGNLRAKFRFEGRSKIERRPNGLRSLVFGLWSLVFFRT